MKRDHLNRRNPDLQSTDAGRTVLDVTGPAGLLEFLLGAFPDRSRAKIKALLERRSVAVNGKMITQFDHPLRSGDRVAVSRGPAPDAVPLRGIDIVFEDEHLIVIDKAAGLLSVATETEKEKTAYAYLTARARRTAVRNRVFVVHRLDRETSGLIMFAKSERVRDALQVNWKGIVHERVYVAVVEGAVKGDEGTIESRILENRAHNVYSDPVGAEGKDAVTHYRVLNRTGGYSLIEIRLDTGRKNQIRVHMKDVGHCVIGDSKYGASKNPIKRLGLHAFKLGFTHPVTGVEISLTSPLPGSFRRLFAKSGPSNRR
jgi:23S rRNA pseudouridine1911/1915/1917 synthase